MTKTTSIGINLVSFPAYQNKDVGEKQFYLTAIKQQNKTADLASRWNKSVFDIYREMVFYKIFPFTIETGVNNLERILSKIFYEEKKDFGLFAQRLKTIINYTDPAEILSSLKDDTKFDLLDQYASIFGVTIIPGTNTFKGWGIEKMDETEILVESKVLDSDTEETWDQKVVKLLPEETKDLVIPGYKESKSFCFLSREDKVNFVLEHKSLTNIEFCNLITKSDKVTLDDITLIRIVNRDLSHIKKISVRNFFANNSNDFEIVRTSLKQKFQDLNYNVSAFRNWLKEFKICDPSKRDIIKIVAPAFYRYFGIKLFTMKNNEEKFDFKFVRIGDLFRKLGTDVEVQKPKKISNITKEISLDEVEVNAKIKEMLNAELDKVQYTYIFYLKSMYFDFISKHKDSLSSMSFMFEQYYKAVKEQIEILKNERGDFTYLLNTNYRIFINAINNEPKVEKISEYSPKLLDEKAEVSPEIAIPSKLESEWLIGTESQVNSLVHQLKNTGYAAIRNAKELGYGENKYKVRVTCKFEVIKD